ncbi:hypothetical protein TCAL_13955, partial [Tigriopus californicus]|eukprot:TCALIF_13955-PA protein Name:"Protein of unknown function" AED:0.19 eAED:0.19 QI:5/1/0.66/1/1/0.66/3/0/196
MIREILILVVLFVQSQCNYFRLFDFTMIETANKQKDWELDGSGMEIKEWPSFDDPTQICDGSSDQEIDITFTDTTGCFRFLTPGFNVSGYPNGANGPYTCEYMNSFGRVDVSGIVTILEEGFEFEGQTNDGRCLDRLVIRPVNKAPLTGQDPDPDDVGVENTQVQFCGTISSDKARTFNNRFLIITLRSTRGDNGN